MMILPSQTVLLWRFHFSGGRLRAHAALLRTPEFADNVLIGGADNFAAKNTRFFGSLSVWLITVYIDFGGLAG